MANTIEVEKLDIEKEVENVMDAPEKNSPTDCIANRFLIYVDMTANHGQSHELATSVSYQYYYWCMAGAI